MVKSRIVSILARVIIVALLPALVHAQSTATLQGTVTDATNSAVPNAAIKVRNTATGEERTTRSDSSGVYLVASLVPGTYRVEVNSPGMQITVVNDVVLNVGATVVQNIALKVASTSTAVEISAAAPVVEAGTMSVGSVVNQNTVQEIPLNGRHFVDLALLIPGSVTPPASGFLTAPLRGQGSFAFNTGGAREDQINYMINGINLSDPIQNQITFQPTINTVSETKIDNSTYSAEYGRNSGAIVLISTRSGTNDWHGEAYEFIRNSYFDARNFTNPVGVHQAPFVRNQFGADGGGPIRKDKMFFYLSYEGLRQRQAVPLPTSTLPSAAQRAAVTDPIIQKLLPLIPQANSPGNTFVGTGTAPVDIDQGTANFSDSLSDSHRINVYYAYQRDNRDEPPTTDGNTIPGYGDQRTGRRQIMTINDTKVFSSSLVNEARLGYNRIHILFAPDNILNAASLGINSGVNAPIGIPQINVQGAFEFGGVNNLPQGRGDYSAAASDTLSWVHGKHSIKIGGEYRRINNNNFSFTPGTFTFPNITAFLNDQASAFTVNAANRANRIYVNSIGAFIQDAYKVSAGLTLELGIRYDWYGTPTEARNRFVVFNPVTVSLVQVGTAGLSEPYNQSAHNFQPRVGLAWDPFHNGRTIIRSAFAVMTDQPTTGLVNNLTGNPPFSFPVSFTTSTPGVLTLANAFTVSGGSVSPTSVTHSYKDSYAQEWNFNIQQQVKGDIGLMIGYFGTKGTDLNIPINVNQFFNGVRPYPALSGNSPIFPGRPLTNIIVYESVGNSSYHGLWLTATKHFAKGLQFNASYTFSKSIDENSRNNLAATTSAVQDSYNISNDRGLSDFDARHRFVLSGIYQFPFKKNRLVHGWELSSIIQLQTGNPINFHTTNTGFSGLGTLRPDVSGPIQVGFSPATNGSAANVTYIQNPGNFCDPGVRTSACYNPTNQFGNLGRNVAIGPGFANIDLAIVKNTKITEKLSWQVRADAFDLFNHANFAQPGGVGSIADTISGNYALLQGTRFPAGDFGSSRQLQLAMKLIF